MQKIHSMLFICIQKREITETFVRKSCVFYISVNPDNTIGAVGFTTMIAPFLYPITLIRFNKDTGEYLRDRNGICIKSKPGMYMTKT